jgi:hypothetical protein
MTLLKAESSQNDDVGVGVLFAACVVQFRRRWRMKSCRFVRKR